MRTGPSRRSAPTRARGRRATYLLLEDADVLFAVPAALGALLPAPRRHGVCAWSSCGGAPVLRPLLERLRAALPDTAIRAIYGMTEVLPGRDRGRRREARPDRARRLRRPPRAPRLGAHRRRRSGRVGEGVALRYLGEPPLTEVRTGDLGELDGDRLTLLGRSKEMFIRGTTNVYPALYEPVIAGLPGVDEAALVGAARRVRRRPHRARLRGHRIRGVDPRMRCRGSSTPRCCPTGS